MNFRFNKAKVSLFKSLIRYVLVGLSAFLLLAVINEAIVSNKILDRGPEQAIAYSDIDTMNDLLGGMENVDTTPVGSCVNGKTYVGGGQWSDGCGDSQNGAASGATDQPKTPGQTDQPVTPQQPAAPTPACNDDVRYCDPNVGKMIHKTGGYWNGFQCVYAFVQQEACGQPVPQPQNNPAPQGGGKACERGKWSAVSCSVCNNEETGMNADGSDWGSYDGQWGSWCGCAQKFSTLQGKAFNSSNFPQCGSASAVPSQPAPQPQQPAPQPQTPYVPAPVAPAPAGQPLPACISLATNIVCGGQRAYDTCHERVEGGVKFLDCVASQNSNCSGTIQCSTPVPQGPTQTTTQTTQCPSGTTTFYGPNNVITCINNSNQQQQTQSQTVTQNNNQIINIPGGIVSRTEIIREQPVAVQVARVDCPAGTVKKVVNSEVICEVTVRSSGVVLAGAKELPKTGLPAIAWAAGALVPMGMKLRRFSKFSSSLISSPTYIWEDREFKK